MEKQGRGHLHFANEFTVGAHTELERNDWDRVG